MGFHYILNPLVSTIDGFMRGRTIIYFEMLVVFPCILQIIAHTVDSQNEFSF